MTHERQVCDFHGNFIDHVSNFMGHEIYWCIFNGPLNLTLLYSGFFMAIKTEFHDPLILVLDRYRLFMAMKKVFMTNEKGFHEAWKHFHGKLMGFNEVMKFPKCNIHGP